LWRAQVNPIVPAMFVTTAAFEPDISGFAVVGTFLHGARG
jgi:hypothetical protein